MRMLISPKPSPSQSLRLIVGPARSRKMSLTRNFNVSRSKYCSFSRFAQTLTIHFAPVGVDFSDLSLYEPGNKIVIPLTLPSFHLTQPCFRDLKKHVAKSSGWELKRSKCTAEEKKRHKVTRKSNAYFVNAIYKVPGTAAKKKKKSKKKASAKSASASASGSASTSTKKRAATTTKATKKPVYKANPEATAALQAALNSAQEGNGVVDPACLKAALGFGYSKAFIDAKVDEQEALNVKPAAKKMKTN